MSLTLMQSIDNPETKVIDYWLNSCSYILKEAIGPNLGSLTSWVFQVGYAEKIKFVTQEN